MGVKEHYDNHLGNVYSWMTGDFATAQASQQHFFIENEVLPNESNLAFDLGAGHGLQAISLAKLGFEVTAVDFNLSLLAELKVNGQGLPVSVIEDDVLNFLEQTKLSPALMVCMGDTLSHLEDVRHVESFIQLAYQKLLPGGKLVLSFRDLSRKLVGEERFIPVRSDASRIFTCFLEYFPDKVMVHDIVHENVNGRWEQRVSAYPKLRLDERLVIDLLEKTGFEMVLTNTINRMIHLIAIKS